MISLRQVNKLQRAFNFRKKLLSYNIQKNQFSNYLNSAYKPLQLNKIQSYNFSTNSNQQNEDIIEIGEQEGEEREVSIHDFIQDEEGELQGESKEQMRFEIDKNDDVNKFVIKSNRFGLLKLIQSELGDKQIEKVNNIYHLGGNIPKNYIRKILKEDRNSLMVFSPKMSYNSMLQLFQSIEKNINEMYYGSQKKPKNPFAKCKDPKEIFNLHRRIQIEKKNILGRICVLVDYDGVIRLQGRAPEVGLMKKFTNSFYKPTTQVIKHDFLLPVQSFLGINSADQYEKTGIQMEILDNKKIFPLYGVWLPTNQHYYNLFEQCLKQTKNLFATPRNIIDLGSGSGILGLMLCQKSKDNIVYAIDKNPDAVKCSRLNSQIVDVAERYNAQEIDMVEKSQKELEQAFDSWHFPKKYDIILANPPWINAKNLGKTNSMDAGNYDYNEQFLIKIFEFASERLNIVPKVSKKGRLLLLYSDLGEIMGIQNKNRIKELCDQYNLKINNTFEVPFLSDQQQYRPKKKVDPLMAFKSQAKCILYEITRY